jgi:hypothetical protein
MRTGICCVLFFLGCSGCVTPTRHCEGSLQPINAPVHSKSPQTPASTEPDGSIP